jgi:hypothetical protein
LARAGHVVRERAQKPPEPLESTAEVDQTVVDPVQGVEPIQGVAPARKLDPGQGVTGAEDEFDREFGGLETRKLSVALPSESQRPLSVYIPPVPGAEVPDSLKAEEIRQVVVANRRALHNCAEEQQKRKISLPTKMVMRWIILPSGRTAEVSCTSDELKHSELAQCVSSLIGRWRFPEHRLQGDPINVPFTF